MLKFKSLPIRGDAFLIEDNKYKYLVDAGGNKKKIINSTPNQLDIAICTHNDSDHANGFIGLLNNKKKHIGEMWLPAIWQPLIKFIVDTAHSFSEDSHWELFFCEPDDSRIHADLEAFDDLTFEDGESFDQFVKKLKITKMNILKHFNFYIPINNSNQFPKKLIIDLNRIFMIARLCAERSIPIVWFEPSPVNDNEIRSFRPLNSKPLLKARKVTTLNFFRLLRLTSTNQYSLVFEYLVYNKPSILLTADSDPNLVQFNSPYSNILVTATHHGSDTNKDVYNLVHGNAITWIRSGGTKETHPGQAFRSLTSNKYCNLCKIKRLNPKYDLSFQFDTSTLSWEYISGGYVCNC